MVTKENKIKIIKYIWYIVGTVSLLMAPVVSYFMFEYVTGNLDTVPYYMAVLNIGWIYVLYLALFAVTGRTRIAVPAASCVLYVISLAETFVVAFRSRPIMLWDVMAFRTAMTVSGNYEFFITRQMKTAFVLLLLMNVFLWFTPRRVRGWKLRLAVGGGIAASIAGYGAWFFAVLVPSWGLGINMWAINGTYQEYGYVLSTAVSLQYVVKKPPQGYSNARLKEIYNRLEESIYAEAGNGQAYPVKSQAYPESPENPENRPEEGQPVTPVNLICIMNESLAELKTAGDFTTNTEYFPFMDSLEENTVRGSLCVPVFGSMTSNTEFEFLTGDSMALLPANSIAYQFNVKPDTYSMVSTLKDQGYYSVAMHPYPGENWNRVECYQNMGFDAFLDQEFYEGSEELRNYVSDEADYQKLIQVVEAKENPEDKLFIFNVTMQNHGGYEGIYDNFEQEVWLTGEYEGKYPKTDQYLSLMKRSDQAFQYLVEYFSRIDEPTMIVMFGDHQPSVEDEFYDDIAGMPSSEITVQEHLMWYETPFIIWTNYSMPSEDMGRLGAVYLSSEVLWRANLEMTPYNRFLLAMKEDLPVVHFLGCYDREGTYYYWAKAESERCPYQDTVLDYEALVYNHSLDRKKFKELFVIDSENSISQ
ncbi:sulfatase [Enterocloster clostridioformis]|uniref:LTA synthase family protein n=1 Tax=Enterocloster clostridioformis TaxID=1531 RepID=UPI00080C9BA7|nr:alkaline phosphatase family protein [Enterocloster clostridioformis]ANU44832.1 sulfatase [Lachnoclostridium sp. YL32]NDO27797.1 sulfatase-like hydrolase/transferase [Enterocloster clostridioformis]OXE70259.1 sulfatase [Enterocloster clostridioformis]QQR00405.1 sulfatase-like hydrolase/transferase [Enterocloster clostridioformis]